MKLRILASCVVIFLIIGAQASAQGEWNATLFMQPYPSPYLSDWEANPNLGYLTINNNTGAEQSVRISLELIRDSEQTIITASSAPMAIPPSPPATILDNTSFVDYESFEYDESIRNDIVMTGRLPEGKYEACIRLENLDGNTLLDNICADFLIVYPDPPGLIYPFDGDNIVTTFPIFQWTALQLPIQYQIHYNLRISEVLPGQSKEQALDANIPHFEGFDLSNTNYLYPLEAMPFEAGKFYAWQVQALDQYGYPPSANQGKSEIWGFIFGDTTPPEPPGPAYRHISGLVLDGTTSEPLTNARVVYHGVSTQETPGGIEFIDAPESLVTKTNHDGYFQVDNAYDSSYFRICVQTAGYLANCHIGLDQYRNGNINGFNITLGENYADIRGRVIEKYSGQSVPGVIVQLWRLYTDYVPPDSNDGEYSPELVQRQLVSARTDSLGVFTMTHIAGGDNYYIVINDSQYDSLTTRHFTVYGGPQQDLGTYTIGLMRGEIAGLVRITGTDSVLSMARVYIYADTGYTFPDRPDDYDIPPFDTQPLFGPDTTDQFGNFGIQDIPLNNIEQITDQYAVYVQAQGYRSVLLPARITGVTPNLTLDIQLSHAPGMIYGTITSQLGGSPVGDAEIGLYPEDAEGQPEEDHYTPGILRAYSNPDGSYILGNVPPGIYSAIIVNKSGYDEYMAPGPITISNGQIIRFDAALDRPSGIVQGIITDDLNTPLFGVIITSPDAPFISEVSQADGSFVINDAPSGSLRLEFRTPGYADMIDTLEVAPQETTIVEITMTPFRGSISVIVRDDATAHPIADAIVRIQGQEDITTDQAGSATFNRLPVGATAIDIIPPSAENDTIDYCGRSTNVEIVSGPNLPVTIALLRGSRISGTVELVGGGPIEGAWVEIQGNHDISDISDSNGRFLLRHVTPGENLALSASKVGYKTGRLEDIDITAGQHLDSLVISLPESPIDSVFGFAIEVDSIAELGGGNKKVIGAIVRVPTTPLLRLADPNYRFYFDDLQVDSQYRPLSQAFEVAVTEVPVKVFGRLDALLCDTTGGYLTARWVDSLSTGEIRGDLIMDNAIPRWIPGAVWATEKIQRNVAPAFWADASTHGMEGQSIGIAATGSSVSAKFWGFGISVDYARTTIDSSGFHYYGSLQFPRLSREIGIEDLNIRKNESTGHLEFAGVTVRTTPPIEIAIGSFRVIDSTAAWNASGFRADGAIALQSLGRQFGFQNLRISPEGDFLSLAITADSSSGTINVLSSQFRIESIEFGTDEATRIRFFQFSGALTLPRISQPIEFQNLKYAENNEFSGVIQFNQSKTFADILTLQLQSIEFNSNDQGKFIFLRGSVAFDIPNLHVQAGNFRFYEDGSFAVEQISMSFNAGPVIVAIEASWSDDIFQGSGSLVVQPAFTAACQFRYAGTSDWWIKVTAGMNIPIGTLTIVQVVGEVGYQEGIWTFGLGGGVTVGQLEKAIRLDTYVRVVRTPEGPIINGSAQVVAFSGMQIGEATINLDFAHSRFTGNIALTFNKAGVEASAQINIDVQSGQYWFVGGSTTLNFFRLAQLNSTLCAADNYNGWMHTFPVTYHPNNQTIDGFHADLSYHSGASGYRWSMSVDTWAYLMVNWNGDLAAGAKFRFDCYADLWIIGGSASVQLEAAIQNIDNCLSAYGQAGASLKLWVGCCNRNKPCWRVCWAWIVPCGFTACFDVSVAANYNCNSGWDYSINW